MEKFYKLAKQAAVVIAVMAFVCALFDFVPALGELQQITKEYIDCGIRMPFPVGAIILGLIELGLIIAVFAVLYSKSEGNASVRTSSVLMLVGASLMLLYECVYIAQFISLRESTDMDGFYSFQRSSAWLYYVGNVLFLIGIYRLVLLYGRDTMVYRLGFPGAVLMAVAFLWSFATFVGIVRYTEHNIASLHYVGAILALLGTLGEAAVLYGLSRSDKQED